MWNGELKLPTLHPLTCPFPIPHYRTSPLLIYANWIVIEIGLHSSFLMHNDSTEVFVFDMYSPFGCVFFCFFDSRNDSMMMLRGPSWVLHKHGRSLVFATTNVYSHSQNQISPSWLSQVGWPPRIVDSVPRVSYVSVIVLIQTVWTALYSTYIWLLLGVGSDNKKGFLHSFIINRTSINIPHNRVNESSLCQPIIAKCHSNRQSIIRFCYVLSPQPSDWYENEKVSTVFCCRSTFSPSAPNYWFH